MAKVNFRSTWTLRYPDRTTGPYSLRLTSAVLDGRLEVVGVEMWGVDPPTEEDVPINELKAVKKSTALNSTDVRLPLRQLLDEKVQDELQSHGFILRSPMANPDWKRRVARSLSELERTTAERRRGRPRELTDEHFREVAAYYRESLEAGRPPTLAVAQAWNVERSTAAKWVARCRTPELGLLAPTTQGRSSGAMKARQRRGTRRKTR